jgi:hypothetical protein
MNVGDIDEITNTINNNNMGKIDGVDELIKHITWMTSITHIMYETLMTSMKSYP